MMIYNNYTNKNDQAKLKTDQSKLKTFLDSLVNKTAGLRQLQFCLIKPGLIKQKLTAQKSVSFVGSILA